MTENNKGFFGTKPSIMHRPYSEISRGAEEREGRETAFRAAQDAQRRARHVSIENAMSSNSGSSFPIVELMVAAVSILGFVIALNNAHSDKNATRPEVPKAALPGHVVSQHHHHRLRKPMAPSQ